MPSGPLPGTTGSWRLLGAAVIAALALEIAGLYAFMRSFT